jgi:hypothetical protein
MNSIFISMYNSTLKRRILKVVVEDHHYVKVKESLPRDDIQHKSKIIGWKRMKSSCTRKFFMFLILRN